MSSLRARLGKPIKAITIDVECDGETYVMSGIQSASSILLSGDGKNEKLTKLWNAKFKPAKFTDLDVSQIRMIHCYAQAPEGEAPYELSVIAEIFATYAKLFIKLLAAANKIAGMDSGESVGEVEGKDSLDAEPTPSLSA